MINDGRNAIPVSRILVALSTATFRTMPAAMSQFGRYPFAASCLEMMARSVMHWLPLYSTCKLRTTGVARGLTGEHRRKIITIDQPYTPAWQEKITGVPRDQVITVAREFAENADKTHGKSMVIIGVAMNHWYHSDMNYRGVINMLMTCGCIGQSGGGWAHYVGQGKLRPQTGWLPLAFALDWIRPPRQMNSTSFFYASHRSVALRKAWDGRSVSPLADKSKYGGSMIDYNGVRARKRMGWLSSAPQMQTNLMQLVKDAQRWWWASASLQLNCGSCCTAAPLGTSRADRHWRRYILSFQQKQT